MEYLMQSFELGLKVKKTVDPRKSHFQRKIKGNDDILQQLLKWTVKAK